MGLEGGRGVGEALLVCKVIFVEGKFDGRDSKGVVSGVCRGGVEEATHFVDGIILCDLEVLDDSLG